MPTHLVQRGRFNFRQQSSNEDGFSRAPVSILIMLTAPLADPWFNLEKNRPSFSDRHLFLRSSEMTRGCSRYFLSVYETMIKKLVFYTISISMGNSKKVFFLCFIWYLIPSWKCEALAFQYEINTLKIVSKIRFQIRRKIRFSINIWWEKWLILTNQVSRGRSGRQWGRREERWGLPHTESSAHQNRLCSPEPLTMANHPLVLSFLQLSWNQINSEHHTVNRNLAFAKKKRIRNEIIMYVGLILS